MLHSHGQQAQLQHLVSGAGGKRKRLSNGKALIGGGINYPLHIVIAGKDQ